MPVINGVYLKDFPALPSSVTDANIIPIAISGNQIAYRTTVAGIVTDARVTSKLLTGLSVTGSTILATDTILQAFGKVQNQLNGKVSSVGLTMPAGFNVANSPITSAGTLAVTAAGVASQYIRGDGALGDFPTTGGGGSSVSYYLNGSVSQGTIGGNAYYEMNKTPVIGTGTDFTINADGYIAQFITDANDPASLLIPGGNWNVEMYFSASSSGGTPSFYVEVYKYDGTTFTLLGSSATTPEGITNGTAIDIYYTSVGIPETVLTLTDRLAIRVYVTHSGRTITLHTEDNHLSEIVTTFSNGLTTLNGLTKQAQYFAVGSTGTDFNISSSVDTHTFNLPTASASNRGALSSANWTTFNSKQDAITLTTTGSSGASTFISNTLNVPNYTLSGLGGVPTSRQLTINGTAYDLSADRTWSVGTVTSVAAITLGTTGTDLSSTVANSTTTPVITLNVPDASATARGVITTGTQTIGGFKTFSNSITLANGTSYGLNFESGTTGFYSILKAPAGLGASILVTLPSTTGTLALTSQLHDAVTLSAIGSTPNANAATLTGQVLNLEPASASFGGVVTTGTQTFAGDKTLTGSLYGIGLSMTGTTADIVQGTATSGKALRGTATTGWSLYASATTGVGVQGNSSGTGGTGVFGSSVDGYGGVFYNDSTTYPALEVNNNNESAGNIAVFRKAGTSVFIINSSGNISNGTYTYTLPSATGTLALTSALSSYLPLSGGTLTGALSGTSATFSGLITSTNTSTVFYASGATTLSKYIRISNTSGDFFAGVETSTGGNIIVGAAAYSGAIAAANGLNFSGNAGTNNHLSIASTGAATFSGQVGATSMRLYTGATNLGYIIKASDWGGSGSNPSFAAETTLGLNFYVNGSATTALSIASTGAATFSSRVTTGGGDGKGLIIEANSSALTIPAIGFNIQTGYNVSYINSYNVSGVSNGIYIGSSLVNISSLGTGTVYSNAGTLTNTNPSDERLKENIKHLSWGLNEILQLKPVSYNWINDKINQGEQYGFIAQDVQKVIPELVKEFIIPANEELETKELVRLGLDKEAIFVGLVKAIQELKAEIDLLKGIAPIEPEPIEEVEPIVEVAAQIEPESEPKAEPVEPEVESEDKTESEPKESDTNTTQ